MISREDGVAVETRRFAESLEWRELAPAQRPADRQPEKTVCLNALSGRIIDRQESTSVAVFAPRTFSIQRSRVATSVHAWIRALSFSVSPIPARASSRSSVSLLP
ncbi:hypothetical protein, partial [Sorangium cellulosum]|uniref:hypothetical protein n=1 Tax=Sorangium cellulosum TaxID=56 RepID=UPI0012DB62A6